MGLAVNWRAKASWRTTESTFWMRWGTFASHRISEAAMISQPWTRPRSIPTKAQSRSGRARAKSRGSTRADGPLPASRTTTHGQTVTAPVSGTVTVFALAFRSRRSGGYQPDRQWRASFGRDEARSRALPHRLFGKPFARLLPPGPDNSPSAVRQSQIEFSFRLIHGWPG